MQNCLLTLCCNGQKSGNLHFLLVNVKYSKMLNLVICISLVAHPFLMLIIILILVLLWITNLHINGIVVRAKQRAALILQCFYTSHPQLLIKAFTVYVRPLLEYCCSVDSHI